MSVVQINRNPTRKQLNQFGFIWLGFLVFFGVIAWFKLDNQTLATVLWVLSVVVPLLREVRLTPAGAVPATDPRAPVATE